ncbi:MAG: hypothetical protein KDA29_03530 [Phycisphaerales bacterium]|nr:hypothetical protein [Phycisphaerales bacterium]
MAADAQQSGKPKAGAIGIKETLTSLIIAFMLAFLFRGFVIEGFLIPTGSMAPTLLGKHLRMQSEQSGYNWSVGPWNYIQGTQTPERMQNGIEAQDPMSGIPVIASNKRTAAGDRVFVLKYLPLLQEPHRWDVVVFKNPGQHVNYIKRLVGLPGEQVVFVDGDVFTRPFIENQTARSGWESWTTDGWQVQRKPERVQREMLQDVFDSSFAPKDNLEYTSPYSGSTPGWEGVLGSRIYRYSGSGSTALVWNDTRPITDFNAYNQTHKTINMFMTKDANSRFRPFPSSDLSLSLDIRHDGDAGVVSPTIDARGMSFRARVDLGAGTASVQMRDASSSDTPWIELDQGSFGAVAAGEWARVEFWHIDQALWLFIDGVRVCGGMTEGAYELSPSQRAVAATGLGWDELENYPGAGDGRDGMGVFADTTIYRTPKVRWDFEGSAFTLSHVRVQRDISYHINQTRVTRGAHPNYFATLNDEQYFMCGDNSANSEDSRLWRDNDIYAWVRTEIDDTPGVVNRDLIVGKAFVVYFPAPLDNGPILAPDFGRLRWIW